MFELKHKKQAIAYGIIGTDRFGYILAKELAAGGIDLLVAGKNGTDIRELREITINAMVIRDYGKKALADAGFNNCDVVIVCLADMTDSILTTLNLGNKKNHINCNFSGTWGNFTKIRRRSYLSGRRYGNTFSESI